MAYAFADLKATLHFIDDSEQGATVTIPHAPADALELIDLEGGDLTAFVPDIITAAAEYDDATDASLEKISFHLTLADVAKETDASQGQLNTVEDKAQLMFQASDGRTWRTTVPAPDQSFIQGDIVDEEDADWASIIAQLILNVYLKGASELGVFLVEYIGGYRIRAKTRSRKPGVAEAHSGA